MWLRKTLRFILNFFLITTSKDGLQNPLLQQLLPRKSLPGEFEEVGPSALFSRNSLGGWGGDLAGKVLTMQM